MPLEGDVYYAAFFYPDRETPVEMNVMHARRQLSGMKDQSPNPTVGGSSLFATKAKFEHTQILYGGKL
jgi:hypothetical protein